jgi:hypothetical protein
MLVRRLRSLGTVLACVLALAAAPGVAFASGEGDGHPRKLWNTFPLGSSTTSGHDSTTSLSTPRQARTVARPASSSLDDSSDPPRSLLLGGALLLGILLFGGALLLAIAVGAVPAFASRGATGRPPQPRPQRPRGRATAAPARETRSPHERSRPAPPVGLPTAPRAQLAAPPAPRAPVARPAPPVSPGLTRPTGARRHREIYDAEYARQRDRVEALRRKISGRLAITAEQLAEGRPANGVHKPPASEPDN